MSGLFIFHRDLRIIDNIGLLEASKNCTKLYTAFIFTPEQVGKSNQFRSNNAVQFMIESLDNLAKEIRNSGGSLITLYGSTSKMIQQLIQKLDIQCLYFNADYTPYARKRDEDLVKLCAHLGVKCKITHDYYLNEPGTILNGSGGFYHKFTPFYDTSIHHIEKENSNKPKRNTITNLTLSKISFSEHITIQDAFHLFVKTPNPDIAVHGGRHLGLDHLKIAVKTQDKYEETRNRMSIQTSLLSSYLKFGCISIREVFHAFRTKYNIHHELIRELIWRDFFAHILYGYPETLDKMHYPKFDQIRWKTNNGWLNSWKKGETGFPLVDASMRQLNQTGYMHNRGRMLVAEFLVKILLLDWREGERHFAQYLTDYDVASNSGNWQSIVGGGVYAMPWFRIMNPWIQSAKYDSDAKYIKQWVPELKDVPPRDIHKWYLTHSEYSKTIRYLSPMVDYTDQKEKALALYRKYL